MRQYLEKARSLFKHCLYLYLIKNLPFNIRKIMGWVGGSREWALKSSSELSWFKLPETLQLLFRDVQNFHKETLNQEKLI